MHVIDQCVADPFGLSENAVDGLFLFFIHLVGNGFDLEGSAGHIGMTALCFSSRLADALILVHT
jgi:hypothetical protein